MAQRYRYGDYWGPSGNCVFDGNGAPSGPNCLLFSDAGRPSDALWDMSGVGWSRRPHVVVLGAPQRAVDRNLWQIMANRGIAPSTLGDVSYVGSGGVGGVGDCTCSVPTLGGLRETSGPRIDRFPSTRPPWWRRQYRGLKKLVFSAPNTCPIDRFGPVANRRVLKQLHAPVFC